MDAKFLTKMVGTAPVDYRLVCRTCLVSDAEFYKLDAPILSDVDDKAVSFLDCLRFCTRLSEDGGCDRLQFPIYICTECSAALQVSYNFIRNALEAHEILRQKLSENITPQQQKQKLQRKNGFVGDVGSNGKSMEDSVGTDGATSKMRFRCKICNEKVETKKTLKEHVKLHLDIISYCCQLCQFETKKRNLLNDHYILAHDTEATRDQLKPRTKPPQPDQLTMKQEVENENKDDIYQQMEQIQNASICETLIKSEQEDLSQQPEIDTQLLYANDNNDGVLVDEAEAATAFVKAATAAAAAKAEAASSVSLKDGQLNSMSTSLEQYGADQFNIAANELSVGNEFIVMADGTVEEVMGNGVVIEYINTVDDGVTLENGLVLDNIMKVAHTNDFDGHVVDAIDMDMDVDDIIIEESISNEMPVSSSSSMTSMPSHMPESIVHTLQNLEDEMPPPAIITPTNLLIGKRIKCKICTSNFQTQDQLKTHMLSHNEIPHFFCDQCTFYTFFKIDLTQHYKTKHKLQPTQKQLQPKNKLKQHTQIGDLKHIYACDLCLYETRIKSHLRRHYLSQHQEEATEVQLRPTIDEAHILTQPVNAALESPPKQRGKPLRPDYPKGLNCKKCSKTFYWRNKLKEHYRQHSMKEGVSFNYAVGGTTDSNAPGTSFKHSALHCPTTAPDARNANTIINSNTNNNNYNARERIEVDAQAIVAAAVAEAEAAAMQTIQMNAPAPDIIMDIPVATAVSTTTASMDADNADTSSNVAQQQPGVTSAAYVCPQIPLDAIPQVVETETTIDNSELDFVFNDALFEDFEEDENEDEDNEEDDGSTFQDLLLTSDDDFDDMLQEQQQQRESVAADGSAESSASTYQPYCVHCNKKFLSQYQFENHMFVHRGLAPYRCEMCTNLYNTKRALIRHYRAVHKVMPTRDMIQAKGDKVTVDHTPIEHLDIIEQKAVTLMCAKCPFESADLQILHIHLNTTHNLADENYILQKLPFECPRCIRSYATKARLIRHLERSHSVATIIQQQRTTNNAIRSTQQHSTTIGAATSTAIATTKATGASSTSTRCGKVYKGFTKNQITQSQKLKMLLENDTDC